MLLGSVVFARKAEKLKKKCALFGIGGIVAQLRAQRLDSRIQLAGLIQLSGGHFGPLWGSRRAIAAAPAGCDSKPYTFALVAMFQPNGILLPRVPVASCGV